VPRTGLSSSSVPRCSIDIVFHAERITAPKITYFYRKFQTLTENFPDLPSHPADQPEKSTAPKSSRAIVRDESSWSLSFTILVDRRVKGETFVRLPESLSYVDYICRTVTFSFGEAWLLVDPSSFHWGGDGDARTKKQTKMIPSEQPDRIEFADA
jgi:hypothetical protein